MMEHETALRQTVETFIEQRRFSARKFGKDALGDSSFVLNLRRGRSPRLSTADKVMVYVGGQPMGPEFLRLVERFLAVTGFTSTELGEMTVGNSSFVQRLRFGMSPTLRTADRVCRYMRKAATAQQWAEIEAGGMGARSCENPGLEDRQ